MRKKSINSPEVIERMARDKLGMIRPSEKDMLIMMKMKQ